MAPFPLLCSILINHLTGLAEPKTTAVQLSAGDAAVHIRASTGTLNKDVNVIQLKCCFIPARAE